MIYAFMQDTHPTAADAPGLIAMAACYLVFAAVGIFWPEKVRNAMDRFAGSWKKGKKGRWHPYRMPLDALRWVVGTVGIAGAVLFIYIAYVGFTR